MERDAWLAQRRLSIGASDWPRILLGQFGGPHAVWREKLGLDTPTDETEGQSLGHALEKTIVDLAVQKLGWGKPQRRRFQVVKQNGIYAATLDALLTYPDGPRVIECKTAGRVGEDAKDGWKLQSQAQMYCSGIRRHAVAALGGGWGGLALRCWEQEYDEELVALALPALETFWEMVRSRTPPAWDGSESADVTLKVAFSGGAPAREPTDEERAWAETARRCKAEAKLAEQQLRASMGDCDALAGLCTWTTQAGRKTVDSKALRETHPDVYAEVVREGAPVRVFRWKGE